MNLLDYAKNRYSQAGQDGIIEQIFRVLGMTKGHFVEFGAYDGITFSNCKKLLEEGWTGVFIESHARRFSKLRRNYRHAPQVTCIHKLIEISGPNSFDNVMEKYAPLKPITFLSIDIDGIDLEIFESIEKFLPLVACVEGGQGAHPFDQRMPTDRLRNVRQSLSVIRNVAEKKGYKILCSFQDTILIKQELYANFHTPSDLMQLYANGLKAQKLRHIPMFANRLRKLHRHNEILDSLLEETHYSDYWITENWEKENRERIIALLTSVPQHWYTP
jgi:hypothetical protein